MQRIVITEVDNTSNNESLSSYDVAYVPGFCGVESKLSTYFRKPTLFTNKYSFISAIGKNGDVLSLPEFSTTQYYPVWSETTEGFLTDAIPDFSAQPSVFTDFVDVFDYYTLTAPTSSSTIYYCKSETDIGFSFETAVDNTKNWVKNTITDGQSDTPELVTGSEATEDNVAKFYSKGNKTNSVMFDANQCDIGYRYALCLLSLGIPVYYEVMNNTTTGSVYSSEDVYTEVNQNEIPFDSTLTYYTLEGSTYTKATGITSYVEGATYYLKTGTTLTCPICIESMYAGIKNRFVSEPDSPDNSFDSMGDYSIKYITSGGYPTFEYSGAGTSVSMGIVDGMLDVAFTRGDSIALIDHTDNPSRELVPTSLGGNGKSVIDSCRRLLGSNDSTLSYGAMFTPWYISSNSSIVYGGDSDSDGYNSSVPASLAYLTALAVQIRDYNPWLAVSGVVRGKVPSISKLHTDEVLTNNVADAYQTLPDDITTTDMSLSINPITYIRNVGNCIWGNRTLRSVGTGTKALNFLNIRGVVSDVKKVLYEAAASTLFEQNTDITWLNYKSAITPLLDEMVSNYILSDYAIIRYTTDPDTGDDVAAYKVLSTIRIQPIDSIEVFDLTVDIENSTLTITE